MSKQAELFQENAVEQINLPDADILYWPYFFEAAKANELLQSFIKELDKYKIVSARTNWPPAKLKIFIEKCGPEELRRILS